MARPAFSYAGEVLRGTRAVSSINRVIITLKVKVSGVWLIINIICVTHKRNDKPQVVPKGRHIFIGINKSSYNCWAKVWCYIVMSTR